jgi:hypothetical protein
MFQTNYLKRLYNIDKAIALLKAEKKSLLEVIDHEQIIDQGSYHLVKSFNDIRKVDLEKYKKIVSQEVYDKSIGVSISTAEKHLSATQLKEITYFNSTKKLKVIKS